MAKSPKEAKAAQPLPENTIPERLNKLFELLKIKNVYFIDDANCKDVDVEIFLGKIRFLHEQEEPLEKLNTVSIEGVNYADPFDVVSATIKEKWPGINQEARLDLLQKINKASEDQQAMMDYEVTPKLKDYFNADKLIYVDPFEWEALIGNLPESLGDNEKVFLIFDQDLKNAGGKFVQTNGVDLIIQLKDSALKDKAICALLTHEIALTDQELYYRQQVKDNNDAIDYADFFPLSKKRLEEPEVFADGIKKTFINKHFEVIKEETIKVVKESYGKALDKIRKFDTYDFDDAIIKSSTKEGVWEIETLLRIMEIIQKDELQLAMSETDYQVKVNKEIKQSILFGEIEFQIPEDYKPYSDKAKIRHKEIYHSGDLINKLHKPIENGDVFELNGEKFILIAQPCDMMIRGKGLKAGTRNAKYVTLLKIDTITLSEYIKNVKKPNSMQHYLANKHGLLYFLDGSTDVGLVQFSEFITADVDILDLIVYSDTGSCTFNFAETGFNADQYNSAWELRFASIKGKIEAFKASIDLSMTNIREEVENRETYIADNFYPKLVVGSSSDKVYNATLGDNIFNFGIKRILGYKNYNAAFLLDRYSRYLSRTAELHDFAQ